MYRLIGGFLLLSIVLGANAETSRDKKLRQLFESGDNGSRVARIGETLAGPCSCSRGEPLLGTHELVFNCTCGSLQCVVVGGSVEGVKSAGRSSLYCK